MHPPFFVVDRNVNPPSIPQRTHVRRTVPQRLDLTPASTNWPPIPLAPPPPPAQPLQLIQLRVVPLPKKSARDMIGRWLIRAGQRMILPQ